MHFFKKRIDPFYIGPNLSFYKLYNFFKLDYTRFEFKSSLITLNFAGRLGVQYILNTLNITQNTKKSQKHIDPLYIVLVLYFYTFF